MSNTIDTEQVSARLRRKSIDLVNKKLLVTRFTESDQEADLSEPANCNGLGRIRHFYRSTNNIWPPNPLPIDPASKALGIPSTDLINAQVFQNAACNWRCWYCYVPFALLNADEKFSEWLSPGELIDLYLREPNRPKIIDLTGGQPDLIPEWVPWTMRELRLRQLESKVYLWSDDNLSNDYFWRFLTSTDLELVSSYPNYGKVSCFKGYDEKSFAFNTSAQPELFWQQFTLIRRLIEFGLDIYGYVTLTTPDVMNLRGDIRKFVDSLQGISENLPLRIVPLEVQPFTPTTSRMNEMTRLGLHQQYDAVEVWMHELESRFSSSDRALPITEVELRNK